MPYISKNTIARVYDAIEGKASEIIGDFTELKRTGVVWKGLSPFANEKTPSFIVSNVKNIFKCFSSGIGGTPVSFLMQKQGYSYPEAVEYLAKKYHVDLEYETEKNKEFQKRVGKLAECLKINSELNSAFQKLFHESEFRAKTKAQRGLTDDTLDTYQIGIVPKNIELQKHIPDFDKMVPIMRDELGIIYSDANTNTNKCTLHHRISVPYLDERGNVTGFTARTLYTAEEIAYIKEKHETVIAKWKNSKESDIFNKSKQLFGIYQAKNAIRKLNFAYLCEGAFDVTAVHQAGAENVIAANGTALTDEHIEKIRKYTTVVTLLYDGDQLGYDNNGREKATIKNAKKLIESGFSVKVKLLPKQFDPGDLFGTFPILLPLKLEFPIFLTTKINNISTEASAKFNHIPEVDFLDYYLPILRIRAEKSKDEKADVLIELAGLLVKPAYEKTRTLYVKELTEQLGIAKNEWKEYFDGTQSSERTSAKAKPKFTKNLVREKLEELADNSPENKAKHSIYNLKFDAKGIYSGVEFDDVKYISLLKNINAGFGFFRYTMAIGNHVLVQVQDNKLKLIDDVYIQDTFRRYISEFKPYMHEYTDNQGYPGEVLVTSDTLLNLFLKKKNYLFEVSMLNQLEPDVPIVLKEDEEHAKFFYRRNGFVKIMRNTIELHQYKELDGFIWEDQVVDRDFVRMDGNNGVVAKFIRNIAGKDDERVRAIRSIIGYLTHFYFKTKLVEIVFTDAALSKDDKSNGQSGKDLLNDLIGYTINRSLDSKTYVSIDGTQLKANDKNKYSAIEINSKFITFSDIYPYFDLRDHFVQIRKGWVAQKMYADASRILTKTSLSTNKSLKMQGSSYYNRVIFVELINYYNEHVSPEDEFGHRFMEDWDKAQWAEQATMWDNYVFECSQMFITNNLRPIRPALINLQRRELFDHTNSEFVSWMDYLCYGDEENNFVPHFKIYRKDFPDSRYYKKELYEKFIRDNAGVALKSQKQFTTWMSKYFENERITYEIKTYSGQDFYAILGGIGKLTVTEIASEEQYEQSEDMPETISTLW